ncbi:MAG: dipeptide epimerase [Raineya sp.]|jgi:L-alanine-DL-glutamate epimerase-like enolase superfamily enzyme|nr:dipeptide epimerase [Raineya sp.]
MHFRCLTYTLHTKETFKTAHGSRNQIDTVIVELADNQGIKGIGEAVPVPYYGYNAIQVQEELERHRNIIESYEITTPESFWEYLNPFLKHIPFAQCALDIAVYDYFAQKSQKPLYKYLGLELHDKMPLSNYTIGIDSIENMAAKIKATPFPIYKIKLGTNQDVEIVKELRRHTDAIFRIDANCAWSTQQTIRYASSLEKLGVELIEQPLKAQEIENMIELRKYTKIPMIADENCIMETDVEKCVNYFDGVNIKLAKCGGITPALRMIKKAKALGLKVMMGCMTESSIGISAIAHLLPLLDYVDMDGALLIANDPAKGVCLDNGKAVFSDKWGLGVVFVG